MEVADFTNFLRNDEINVKNEKLVFDAAVRWMEHDPDNRKCHTADLLKCCRLALLNNQVFVEQIKVWLAADYLIHEGLLFCLFFRLSYNISVW